MGFSGQEYRSGLPFPTPGDLPDPGIEPKSLALQADALTSEPLGPPLCQSANPPDISPHSWREVNKSKARVGLGWAGGSLRPKDKGFRGTDVPGLAILAAGYSLSHQ